MRATFEVGCGSVSRLMQLLRMNRNVARRARKDHRRSARIFHCVCRRDIALLVLAVLFGCAHAEDQRVDAAQYFLASPSHENLAWEAMDFAEAERAYRGPQREIMTFFTSCRLQTKSPRVLARQLTTGVAVRNWKRRESVMVAGYSGWLQEFEIDAPGEPRTMKTVTIVANKCSYDWVLIAGKTFPAAVEAFDAWWSSLRLGDVSSAPSVESSNPVERRP